MPCMGETVQLDYFGPRRGASPVRVRPPVLEPSFWRSVLTIVGVWMAMFHCGVSKGILRPGPPPHAPLSSHEVLIQYAWVVMLVASGCTILRLPRPVYAACAAFSACLVGLAVPAATREPGWGLMYGIYGIMNLVGFVTLAFAAPSTMSRRQHHGDRREPSPLPGLAFIWSVLTTPVGLFVGAVFAFVKDFPTESELKMLSWIFLVALPITSFVFSAYVWSHIDRNANRLSGGVLATVAWVISSLSLIVALCVGIGMLVAG